jgi:hypothetical protein
VVVFVAALMLRFALATPRHPLVPPMSRKSIKLDILKKVVADANQVFTTKDISEDERMCRAHPELIDHSHYHAFVGGALSDHHVPLDIIEVQKSTSRGSRWQKQVKGAKGVDCKA